MAQKLAFNGSRILVTGGAGFIGANLVRMLLSRGHKVTVIDNLCTGRLEYHEGLAIEFIEGDILNYDLVRKVVSGQDGIVHLAAQSGIPGSIADPRRDCEINVIGTLNMLESARHSSVNRFVFASSNAPLGRQFPPATEDKAPLPISPYGASKLAGEAYCLAYNASWNLGTVVLRFGNVYGPFSAHKNSVVAKFFKDILVKGCITIDGDGTQTRDFIYVQDLCRVLLLALESQVSGEVFQVARGVETSILELAKLVLGMVRKDVGVRHRQARQGDIRRNYSAITKVQHILGWKPMVELHEGLRKTYEWFTRQNLALAASAPEIETLTGLYKF